MRYATTCILYTSYLLGYLDTPGHVHSKLCISTGTWHNKGGRFLCINVEKTPTFIVPWPCGISKHSVSNFYIWETHYWIDEYNTVQINIVLFYSRFRLTEITPLDDSFEVLGNEDEGFKRDVCAKLFMFKYQRTQHITNVHSSLPRKKIWQGSFNY